MNRQQKIIHLEKGGEHFYFSTIAGIFYKFTPEELGIGKEALWNYGINPRHPFQNRHCTIRMGVILKPPRH